MIGRSAFVTEQDEKIIIQSHLLKIRVLENNNINPYYLLYLLHTPFVQKQIQKYTFIQGTISTVGDRFYELSLPIHTDIEKIKQISNEVKDIIEAKKNLRERIDNLIKI